MTGKEVSVRFDKLEERFDKLEKLVAELKDNRLPEIVPTMTLIGEKLELLEDGLRSIDRYMNSSTGSLSSMEGLLRNLEGYMVEMKNTWKPLDVGKLSVDPEGYQGRRTPIVDPPIPEISKTAKVAPGKLLFDAACLWLGMHEVVDAAYLMARFKAVRIIIDPVETSWCAAVVCAWIRQVGYKIAEILKARTFIDLYQPVDGEAIRGDIAVLEGHVAIVAGYGPVSKKITDVDTLLKHLSPMRENDTDVLWVIGGNQSNEVNASPLEWYTNTKTFLGFRRIDDQEALTGDSIRFDQFEKKQAA